MEITIKGKKKIINEYNIFVFNKKKNMVSRNVRQISIMNGQLS